MPENTFQFPLVDSSYDNQEIIRCIEVLLSGQLTMGARVKAFEEAFATTLGAEYAVMVNSGSSANLLAVSALINPYRAFRLNPGDAVAVPAVCWSTSLWPVIQTGLSPILVDVDPETLNLSLPDLERAISERGVKAVMMVHTLGNSTDLGELLQIVERHGLFLIEDTCESLGSTYEGTHLGTMGEFGTFSFYFSHHMTTIEGGMVVASTIEDADLLRALRAHGWSREQSRRTEMERDNPTIDPRFLFVNVGYNVRPTELQAAFGLEQLGRLSTMNASRRDNVQRLRNAFTGHPSWRGQMVFPRAGHGVDPCWFGFPFLLTNDHIDQRRFVQELMERGVDTRPIVSGNMALQPALKHFDVDLSLGPYEGAQTIHDRGLFIGCHATPLEEQRVERLVTSVLDAHEHAAK